MKKYIAKVLASTMLLMQCTPLAYGRQSQTTLADGTTQQQDPQVEVNQVHENTSPNEEIWTWQEDGGESLSRAMNARTLSVDFQNFRASFYEQMLTPVKDTPLEEDTDSDGSGSEGSDSEVPAVSEVPDGSEVPDDSEDEYIKIEMDSYAISSVATWRTLAKELITDQDSPFNFDQTVKEDEKLEEYLHYLYLESLLGQGGTVRNNGADIQTLDFGSDLVFSSTTDLPNSTAEDKKAISLSAAPSNGTSSDTDFQSLYSLSTTAKDATGIDLTISSPLVTEEVKSSSPTFQAYLVYLPKAVDPATESTEEEEAPTAKPILYPITHDLEQSFSLLEGYDMYLYAATYEAVSFTASYRDTTAEPIKIPLDIEDGSFLENHPFVTATTENNVTSYTIDTDLDGNILYSNLTGANAPSRTGYSFDGWTLTSKVGDSTTSKEWKGETFSEGDKLTANWILDITVDIKEDKVTLDLATEADKTATLTATVTTKAETPEDVKSLNWTSDNESSVTVDKDGKVTGISIGTAYVTATSKYNKSVFDSAYVTVEDTSAIAPSLSLDKNTLALDLNGTATAQLTATLSPSTATQNMVWLSSNSNIASVDPKGNVTAKGEGTATITVSSTIYSGVSATCEVTVSKSNVALVAINLPDYVEIDLKYGTTLDVLSKLDLDPINATIESYTWSSSANSVATISTTGLATATTTTTGTTTISVNVKDYTGKVYPATTILNVTNTSSEDYVSYITLDKTEVEIDLYDYDKEEDLITLKPSIFPETALNKTVTWSSSNPAVATVAGGVITPLTIGTTTITVTSNDKANGTKTATCVVTVVDSEEIIYPVTDIIFNIQDITLDMNETVNGGNTYALSSAYTILPTNATNKNVTWSSTNTKVAQVTPAGVVLAMGEGTATITVTTVDGGKTDILEVTVTSSYVPNIPVQGISLNRNTLQLDLANSVSYTLVPTITPSNASNQEVIWTSSNTSVATVSADGVVMPRSIGIATITATTSNGGYTAKCEVTVGTTGYVTYGFVVSEKNIPLEGLTVTLLQNGKTAYSTTTDEAGYYCFANVTGGMYNLVISNGTTTRTSAVTLTEVDRELTTIIFYDNGVSTTVNLSSASNAIVVNGLQTIADSMAETDATVELVLDITATTSSISKDKIVDRKSNDEIVAFYFDVDLQKITTSTAGLSFEEQETITETDTLLEIVLEIPSAYQGKQNYSIYRTHNGTVDQLSTSANRDGEKIAISSDGTRVSILAKKFSTYALTCADTDMYNPDKVYTLKLEKSINGENSSSSTVGDVNLSTQRPEEDEVVVIMPYPNYGFAVSSVTAKESDGTVLTVKSNTDGSYQYTQNSADVTVHVAFITTLNVTVDKPSNSTYADVSVDDPFCDAVNKITQYGLMQGTGPNQFSPYDPATRAMIVTILYNLSGQYGNWTSDFSDVHSTDYYSTAVAWAQQAGIVSGYHDGTFRPNQNITREELAVILYNYVHRFATVTDMVWQFPLSFTDNSSISSWATASTTWCVNKGFLDERYNNFFLPQAVTTRAEIAVALVTMITSDL